jgi:diguanylate cyclase (GGDEF)-like protein/PAS domain S-box-containing protein
MASGSVPHVDALRQLGEALGRSRSTATQAAQLAVDTVARSVGEACGVWLWQGTRLVPLARAGTPAAEARLDDLLPAGDPHPDRSGWQERAVTDGAPGILLPLVADGRTVGVLGARRCPPSAAYDTDDLVFLRAVADRLAATTDAAALRHEVGLARTRARALLQRSAEGVLIVEPGGRIAFVGPAASELLGWDPHELVGMAVLDLVHPEDTATKRARMVEALTGSEPVEPFDARVRHADGSYSWVEDHITNLLDDPDVAGLVINFHDVGARRAAQEALRRSESRYRSIAETAQEGIWVIDPEGGTVFGNQKLAEILGRPLDQVYRMRSTDILSADAVTGHVERLRRRQLTGHEVYEATFVRGDEETRIAQVSASPLFEDGRYVGSLGMFTDITDRRRTERQLERQALYDGLTGLANRALLTDRLGLALATRDDESPGAVVLFLDLDHFKLVNDSYGHAVGDRLLVQVAERLSSVVRMSDTVARFAGDEFVIVCPGLDEGAGNALAGRALAALSAPFDLDGIEVQLGASIGVAHAGAGQDSEAVVGAAGAARAGTRLQEMADLRRALAAGEFVVFYQPQVDLGTDRLVGLEALVRWQHPTRGLIEPAEFISLAERTGLIVPLGRVVLAEACAQAARWARDSAHPPRVSVNVSARQLQDDRLFDHVRDTLEETGLPPSQLRLELTESTVMDDNEQAIRVLRDLRSLGVGTSLDDFGTGYSSLAHLTRLPLDELKIDREFVAGVHLGGEDLEVVRAIVAMGHALGLDVVAEGVESGESLRPLRELGCDLAQGFLFAPPEPARTVEKMFQLAG